MATEYTLRRTDGQPFGSFEEAQALIRAHFPTVMFFWTTSGLEKLRQADANKVKLPPHIRAWMATLPSLLEGVAEGDGYHVGFGLGNEQPVVDLYVEPRGDAAELRRGLEALEAVAGAELRVSGSL